MKKRLMKRVCALALSALLAGAVIQPVGALAQEAGADQTLQGGEASQTLQGGDTSQTLQGGDASQTLQGGDTGQTLQGGDADQTLQGGDTSQTLQGGDTSQTLQGGDAGQSGQNGEADQSGQNGDAGQSGQNGPQVSLKAAASALSSTYDTTKPVIEQVELVRNGETLTTEDQIELRIKAYDAQSGIKTVTAWYSMEGAGSSPAMSLEYDEGQGLYIGTLDLGNVVAGKLYFGTIQVVDQNGNYALADCYDEQGEYLYWVEVENTSSIKVTDIQFPINGQTVAEDDINDKMQGLSLTIDQELPEYSYIYMEFKSQEGDTLVINVYNIDERSQFTFNYWYSSSYLEDKTVEYSLERIYLQRDVGEEEITFEESGSYSLKVAHKASAEETKGIRVTGIEMTRQGEIVKPGEEVEITVYAESDQEFAEYAYGTAYFYAAADIADGYKYVDLIYDEQQDCWTGTFEITEDTYPCEWYLSSVHISDGHSQYENYSLYEQGLPYYVNVFNGDAFVDPVQNLSISILKKNENGYYVNAEYINKENVGRRTTLKELGITLPEFSSEVEGVNQIGWIDDYGNTVTEDTPLLNNGYITIYASYDKNAASVTYQYAADNGEQKYVSQTCLVDNGITYGELWEKASAYMPDDMTQQYEFEKWEISDSYHSADELLPEHGYTSVSMQAKYAGNLMLGVSYYYYDEEGYSPADWGTTKTLMVKEETSLEEVMKELEEPDVAMYEGLRFTGWNINYYGNGDDTALSNGGRFSVSADYENCMIRYVVDPRYENYYSGVPAPYETLVCQVAEVGDTLTIPQTVDGYDSVQWVNNWYMDGSFVAESSMTFYGFGVKSGEENTGGENTDGGNTNGGTENPGNAGGQPSVLPSETINSVVSAINGAAAGENITVAMGGATVVPKEILEAAKGKDVNIVLDMGGYTWTINGMDILASELKDINLEVKFDTNAIPSNVVKAMAGDNPVRQISLTHNGDFGFKATLTMNAGAEYSGKYGNLYYYDSDGKMVFINAGTIDESGNVSLEFSHASDYLLVMSDKQMSQADVPDEFQTQGEGTGAEANTNGVKTGDETNAVPYLVLMILCAGVVGTIVVRKKYFTK